jgi:hypothetical protein
MSGPRARLRLTTPPTTRADAGAATPCTVFIDVRDPGLNNLEEENAREAQLSDWGKFAGFAGYPGWKPRWQY